MFFGSSQPKLLTDAVWKYETWLLNRFDRVICQTRAGANMFKKRGLKSRVEIIANGINLEKYTHANGDRFRKKYGFKKPFALFIGRMDASKNPDWILAAAKRLPDVEFIMSGKGVLEEELKRRSPKNIKWLGKLPREDLLDCYAAAEALLMPSAIETEGLVAQEAMACGTPALISNLDVLAEVVGQGGSVCKSAHDMADQLEHLLDDKPRHALMRQDALKEIRKRDIKRSIAQLVDLYHSLA